MKFQNAAAELVAAYRCAPRADPLDFSRADAYRQFVEVAERTGFTGPDVEMDLDFAERHPDWVARASDAELQRWVHTIVRSDRWNEEYPTAVMDACRSGCLGALVARLDCATGSFHARR